MTNYKLILEYDGTDYHGLQRQPGLPTIQGVLEKALEQVASVESPLYAAGRTDAGVHARGQVVNFFGSLKAPPEKFPAAVNAFLPPDIVVRCCEEAGEGFNARSSAVGREYIYYIHLGDYPSPFHRRFTYYYGGDLDGDKMGRALRAVTGVHDFASFCRREEGRPTVREVHEAEVWRWGEILGVRVKANAFAWMMMRMLCGSLLEVGRGKWSVDYFQQALGGKDNSLSGPALPAQGLVLEKVYY
jgi:tRNA pseudouridine38-40 synthase